MGVGKKFDYPGPNTPCAFLLRVTRPRRVISADDGSSWHLRTLSGSAGAHLNVSSQNGWGQRCKCLIPRHARLTQWMESARSRRASCFCSSTRLHPEYTYSYFTLSAAARPAKDTQFISKPRPIPTASSSAMHTNATRIFIGGFCKAE